MESETAHVVFESGTAERSNLPGPVHTTHTQALLSQLTRLETNSFLKPHLCILSEQHNIHGVRNSTRCFRKQHCRMQQPADSTHTQDLWSWLKLNSFLTVSETTCVHSFGATQYPWSQTQHPSFSEAALQNAAACRHHSHPGFVVMVET